MIEKKTNNKGFGILFFLLFVIVGLWPMIRGNQINIYFILLSLPFLILGLLNSKILTPLNNAWIKFGEILGAIIAPIIMSIVYFIILTPIGLLVRLFGKDLLGLRFSKKTNSYWIKRQKDIGTMDKQF
tara:strand:- start:419 stop:802 length:384 start_codon:yes stop_codon:yes gene_type:complete